ncbi:hypothetical protein CWI38_1530p0010, partial [Hamiltosporidium tvaerminnensis]
IVTQIRKLPRELIDSKITGEYAEFHVPTNVSDAARIIQAAQVCYSEKSIESKLCRLVLYKDLFNLDLTRINDFSRAVQEEIPKREFSLTCCFSVEISEFWSKCETKKINTVTFLEGICVYKHLGIIEDSRGVPTIKSFEATYCTRFNARNLFQAIKKNLISLLNYHIDFDYVVRAVLVKNKIHIRLRCKERLSFPRKELGRCLHRVENNNKTYPSLIKNFLKIKYGLEEEIRNVFWGAEGMCQHSNQSRKTIDHLATRCEKMFSHDYKDDIRSGTISRNSDNEYAEIRVDTRIKTDVKIRCNGPDIFILDKRQNRITLIDVGITTQDSIRIMIPYVIIRDGVVTKYHKTYVMRLKQEDCIINCYFRAEMHKQPTPPLKIVDNEEDDLKSENSKHILPLILHSMTTAKEPKTNTNEVLEL